MFEKCEKLNSLNLENFYTPEAIYMNNMFSECRNLFYLNIENFNTINVIDMQYMFYKYSTI